MVWTSQDRAHWVSQQKILRSYSNDVIAPIQSLRNQLNILKYGHLSMDAERYPLYLVLSKNLDPQKKTVLITGGVHGYETSGVHGALGFFQRVFDDYSSKFNFIGAPCISPWAYETINRWNAQAIDPNRSFFPNSPAEECALFLEAIKSVNLPIWAHFDLHETTDTDNTVFRPALEERDGIELEFSEIPDGFYLVGDSCNPQDAFQKAIIEAVEKITHIAPADSDGKLIGSTLSQKGVINYDVKKLFLCTGFSSAEYTTTTEVYPDSPRVTPELCVTSQVTAICGGLNYLIHL